MNFEELLKGVQNGLLNGGLKGEAPGLRSGVPQQRSAPLRVQQGGNQFDDVQNFNPQGFGHVNSRGQYHRNMLPSEGIQPTGTPHGENDFQLSRNPQPVQNGNFLQGLLSEILGNRFK